MTDEAATEMLDGMIAALNEHFDAVQIMVSWNEEGKTFLINRGGGNWYARQGMAHDFITADKAQTQAREIGQRLEPPPDESDDWKSPAQ